MNPREVAKNINADYADGAVIRILIQPSYPGVRLPDHLMGETSVMLDFCLGYPIPIQDLTVDEDVISGTFSFQRRPFLVIVPFGALIGWSSDYADQAKSRGNTRLPIAHVPPGVPANAITAQKAPVTKPNSARPAWFRGVVKGGKA